MPASVLHVLSATTPDDPAYEIQPQHWNSGHAVSLNVLATEISQLFSNANGVSFGLDGTNITGSVVTTYQPAGAYLTTAALSQDSSKYAGINGAITGGSITVNTSGVSVNLPAYLTTAQPPGAYLTTAMASNRGTDFVQAAAAFAGTSASGTIASNGISVSIGPYITTGALSNHSHGNPTLALTNLTGTTASASNGFTLSLSAAAPGAGGGIAAAAGTQTGTSGTILFNNSNGITFGMSGSTQITASHNGLTTARASNDAVGLNTAQTNVTWTVNSSGISINAGGYLTTAMASNRGTDFVQATAAFAGTNASGTIASNGISVSVAAPGGGAAASVSFQEIMDGARMTTCAIWNNATYSNRPIFVPFRLGDALYSVGTVRVLASRTATIGSLAGTIHVGLYSFANSTSMNLVSSTSNAYSLSASAAFSGIRIYDVTGLSNLSLSQGMYVLGLLATIAGTASWGLNLMGGDGFALAGFVLAGTNSSAATNSQSHLVPMWGVWNATSGALPAAVAKSSVSGGNSANSPDVYAVIGNI